MTTSVHRGRGGLDSRSPNTSWQAIAGSIGDGSFQAGHASWDDAQQIPGDQLLPVTLPGAATTRPGSPAPWTTRRTCRTPSRSFFGVGAAPHHLCGMKQGYTGVKYEREGRRRRGSAAVPDRPEQFSELWRDTYASIGPWSISPDSRPWLTDADGGHEPVKPAHRLHHWRPGRRAGLLSASASGTTPACHFPPAMAAGGRSGVTGPVGVPTCRDRGWSLLSDEELSPTGTGTPPVGHTRKSPLPATRVADSHGYAADLEPANRFTLDVSGSGRPLRPRRRVQRDEIDVHQSVLRSGDARRSARHG